jgi:hypothetical protein
MRRAETVSDAKAAKLPLDAYAVALAWRSAAPSRKVASAC